MIAPFSSIFICIHPLSGRSYLTKRRLARTRGIEFNLTLPARAIRPKGFQVGDTRFIKSLPHLRRLSALLLCPRSPIIISRGVTACGSAVLCCTPAQPPKTDLQLGHLDPPRASRHQDNLPSSQPTRPALQVTPVGRSSQRSLHRRQSFNNLTLSLVLSLTLKAVDETLADPKNHR